MEKQNSKEAETIKMVERALHVLDLLRTSRCRLGVNDIAKKCELTPSTAFRILKTLEKSGWVFQLTDDRYITGQKISFVTEKTNLYLALQDISNFIMQQFTQKYDKAMNLMVREGTHVVILQQSRTNSFVDYVPPLHSKLPIYACSGGKVILSDLPISHAEQIIEACELKPLTSRTITNPEEFWKELRLTAKRGYAFDDRESTENGSCIAVPVRDPEGNVIAALSFSGFISLENVEELIQYLPPLKEAAEKISKNLYVVGNDFLPLGSSV